MSRHSFRIAALTLAALVIVGLSAEAAVAGDSPSLLERAACHVCYLVDCLLN